MEPEQVFVHETNSIMFITGQVELPGWYFYQHGFFGVELHGPFSTKREASDALKHI